MGRLRTHDSVSDVAMFILIGRTHRTSASLHGESVSFTGFFLPTPLYWLDSHTWVLRPAIWIAALLFQFLIIGFLFHLQKQQVTELSGCDDQVTAASQVQPAV